MQLTVVFILIAMCASTAIAQSSSCGLAGASTGLIINGALSEEGRWPWIASIHDIKNSAYFCGGSLIGPRMVLSAAHCFQKKSRKAQSKIVTAKDIIVKLGKYDLTVENERHSIIKFPTEVIIHPKWRFYELKYDADIAIIILESDVENSPNIFPICLADPKTAPLEQRGVVVGWGKAEFDRPHENQPRQLWLTTWANAACFLKNSKLADISSENTFCAGVDVDAGTCFGDSGSGMFMKLDTRHYFLRGIVSSGFEDETKQSCDVKAGSIFTDVLKYTEWINQVAFERDTIIPKLSQEPTFVAKPKNYDKEIFCFFESWANGRAGDGSFTVNHLKPELCTHLVFLHADMEDDNLKSINEWEHTDINGLKLFKVFNDLKKTYRLKTLLAMGSWNEGSVKYSQLSADPERRKKFAENSAEYLKENGFDGLHFHWEHPAHRGGAREDKANFVLLLKDIKKVYQKKNLNLTALVRVQDDVVEKAYDLPNISKHVDRIMMMDFDLAGYWDGKVGFPAAIRGEAAYTLESRVNFFISSGVPAEKIILGVPFFGRTFMSPTAGNVGDPSQDGFAGPFFQEKGFLGYNEFCHMRKTKTWDLSYDETASQAIGKNKEGSLTNVVIYDSPRVLVNKVKFVADKKLSGVWTWFVDSDDFRGDCEPETTTFADFPNARVPARKEKDFPLLRTINDAMAIFSPKIVQEIDQREPATPKPFPGISPRPSSINKAGVEGSRPVGFSGVGDPFDLTQTLIFKH